MGTSDEVGCLKDPVGVLAEIKRLAAERDVTLDPAALAVVEEAARRYSGPETVNRLVVLFDDEDTVHTIVRRGGRIIASAATTFTGSVEDAIAGVAESVTREATHQASAIGIGSAA